MKFLSSLVLLLVWNYTLFGQTPTGSDFGNHLVLNGSTDYVNIPASSLMAFSGNATLEATVTKNSGVYTGQDIIFINCIEPDFWGIQLQLNNGFADVAVVINSVQYDLISKKALASNRAYHIAGVRDGGNLYLYIDGTLDTLRTIPTNSLRNSSNSLSRIGYSQRFNNYIFGGCIDEVRAWNYARTQTQINASKNQTLAGNESGLVAYFQLNETGAGQNITIQNTATLTGSALNGVTVGRPTTPYFLTECSTANYFRSRRNGNWNDVNTWETSPFSDFSAGVESPALAIPTETNSSRVTVQSGHTVSVTADASSHPVLLDNNGRLIVSPSAKLRILP